MAIQMLGDSISAGFFLMGWHRGDQESVRGDLGKQK